MKPLKHTTNQNGKKMTQKGTIKSVQKISGQLKNVEKELNSAYLERKAEIRSLIITLLANENIALVGPPGVGKTGMVGAFTQLINGVYFNKQVDGFTQPEDILGHHSFKKLREDDVRQLKTANYASEADIAYIGEGFKMNNTMMNSMLLLLNERCVDVGEGIRKKATTKMIITDSNEYPTDGELAAFWDRWVVRMHVSDLCHDSSFDKFWDGFGNGSIGQIDTSKAVSMKSVEEMRSYLWLVDSGPVKKVVKHIRSELMKEDIVLSTRRWGKIKKMLHASSLYNGRMECTSKDLEILNHCLWRTVDERAVVNGIISKCIGGDVHAAHKLLSQARRAMSDLQNANIPSGAGGVQYLGPLVAQMQQYHQEAIKLDNSDPDIAEATEFIAKCCHSIGQMVNDRLRVRGA